MDVLRQEIFLQKLATGMENALKSTMFSVLLNIFLLLYFLKTFYKTFKAKRRDQDWDSLATNHFQICLFIFIFPLFILTFPLFIFIFSVVFFALLLPPFQPPFKEKQWDHKDRDSSATNKVSFTRPRLLSVWGSHQQHPHHKQSWPI